MFLVSEGSIVFCLSVQLQIQVVYSENPCSGLMGRPSLSPNPRDHLKYNRFCEIENGVIAISDGVET